MNGYSQQAEELTEVTINQEVFDFMDINNELVSETTDGAVDIESVLKESIIMCNKKPSNKESKEEFPVSKATKDKKTDLVKKEQIVVKTEVDTEESLVNFRALTLNEVIELWSDLSKIPTPECKCRSKLKKQKK